MTSGSILPVSVRLSARPGESAHQDFVIKPINGVVTATLTGASSLVRLTEFVAFDLVEDRLTDEEFEQLPPKLRTEEHRVSFRFVETGRAGAGEPLPVRIGQHVRGEVECMAPEGEPASFHRATLVIDGLKPDPTEVPIVFVIGATAVEFLDQPIVVHPFQFSTARARVSIAGAPDTDLVLEATHGFLEVPPQSIRVPSGESVTTTLKLRPAPQTPLGVLSAVLTVRGNSDAIESVPFEVLVQQPVRPPELNKPLLIEAIDKEHGQQGGASSRQGYPTSPVIFSTEEMTAKRGYRGGEVTARLESAAGGIQRAQAESRITRTASVKFLGFTCLRESESDQLSPTDEPYFAITAESADGRVGIVQKFGPFEGIRTASEIVVGAFLINNVAPNPMRILVQAYEHDRGDPNETIRNLQAQAAERARQFQSLIATSGADAADGPGLDGGAAAVLVGPLGRLTAAGVVSAFGLDDDFIGQGVELAFVNSEDVKSPPQRGLFQGRPFNSSIRINGGGEGEYEFFFDIRVTEQ